MQNKDYLRLLDCPFCGGIPAVVEDGYKAIAVHCFNCGADITAESEKKARAAWNRRAKPANEPLVTCGECVKYQTPNCAAKHEQALMDFCSHGIRKPGGEQE